MATQKPVVKQEQESKKYSLLIAIIIVLAVVVGLWLFTYYSLKNWDTTDRGTFGDMFGAVNAAFSGLAFGGIIITIIFQSKELKLQRLELEATRKELQRTARAQERSEIALTLQTEALLNSAMISANSSMIQYWQELEDKYQGRDPDKHSEASKFKLEHVDQLKQILNNLHTPLPDRSPELATRLTTQT